MFVCVYICICVCIYMLAYHSDIGLRVVAVWNRKCCHNVLQGTCISAYVCMYDAHIVVYMGV